MEDFPPQSSFDLVAERLKVGHMATGLGRIAMTAASFLIPPRRRLYRTVRRQISDQQADGSEASPPALHPDIATVQAQVDNLLVSRAPTIDLSLDSTQQSRLVSVLCQFSDRNGAARYMRVPGDDIRALHRAIVDAGQFSPTTTDRQLDLALEATNSLPEAVWRLFLTTRQYARWRDSAVIEGFGRIGQDEAITEMLEWERSLAGYKSADRGGYQDRAGDTYYVWTHALARLLYSQPVAVTSLATRFYRTMFENGSKIMSLSHRLGRLGAFGTMSNHVIAGEYGNAIGDRLVDYARQVRSG